MIRRLLPHPDDLAPLLVMGGAFLGLLALAGLFVWIGIGVAGEMAEVVR